MSIHLPLSRTATVRNRRAGFCALERIFWLGLSLVLANVVRATSVVPPSFDELVNQSDYVVRAVVKSIVAEPRATPSGSTTIYSKVELEIKEVIAGTPPAKVVLEILGGTYGGRELAIEGAPKFDVGDDAIFFVQGNGRQIFPLVRMMHGVYPIAKEPRSGREYVRRSDGAPLMDVNEVSVTEHAAVSAERRRQQAVEALTPADFGIKIRATAHEPHLLGPHAQ